MMVDNNFIESFNVWILKERHVPIIKMLEEIRMNVMNLLATNRNGISKWNGDFSPYALKLYNDYREIAHYCKVEFNCDFGYEISESDNRHIVDLKTKICACRVWQLSGETLSQIHLYYSKETYSLTYNHKLQPVKGKNLCKVEPAQAMEPPDVSKNVVKPRVKRTREPDEAWKRAGEWSYSSRPNARL
ncbi:uncharacterized protein [Nicotiana sylvestris]|uniref:uncharacterized protein n=1 Tax=Nicotiana sylvestris TaxID=4096 RepID=UPI00388CDE8F